MLLINWQSVYVLLLKIAAMFDATEEDFGGIVS